MRQILSAIAFTLIAILSCQAQRVSIRFSPESEEFVEAAREYQALWEVEGDRIIEVMESVSGLEFLEREIQAIVFEGVSNAGGPRAPMRLRASYPAATKKATLIHELGHRHLGRARRVLEFAWPPAVDSHRILFLFLYDVWEQLYGKDFADEQVEVECRRGFRYREAWEWVLAHSKKERVQKFAEFISGKVIRVDEFLRPPIWVEFTVQDHFGVGEPIPLEATASASAERAVRRVEFLMDGQAIGKDPDQPFEFTLNGAEAGRHVFTARVHDSEGNETLATHRIVFVGIPALERYIAQATDDMEEWPDGSMDRNSSDLELIEEPGGEQVVAMRFTEIRIVRGAEIREAYLQFTVDEVSTKQTDLIIQVEQVGDAAPLTTVHRNLSSRQRSSASVRWLPEPWDVVGESGLAERTPNLSGLIEEVVNRPDWQEGNAIVFLISGSGKRVAESYEGGGGERAPRLHIETR